MANLFWKTKQTTKCLLVTPFKTEEEFEKIVFETPEILEDIFLLKRQVRGGNKKGIPDIVGIDNDGNICIVEMKNVTVDASIIHQVLHYAIWAETNPDSIKSLWLECANKPDDVSISWEKIQVKIVIIAPTILPSTLEYVNKIKYLVDLFEINRWVEEDNQFLLVKKLEPEEKKDRTRPVKGTDTYDVEFYGRQFNKDSAKQFMRYCKETEDIVRKNNWALDTKYNKTYCGFKAGFFNVLGVEWINSKTFAFWVKVSELEARKFSIPYTKYSSQWKQAYYSIDPQKTKTHDFIEIFEKAYKDRTGE
jgi:hypothetical protein